MFTALPADVVGTTRRVYEALQEMHESTSPPTSPGLVAFRQEQLATAARCSSAAVRRALNWLVAHEYVTYSPGTVGRLSTVQFRVEQGV